MDKQSQISQIQMQNLLNSFKNLAYDDRRRLQKYLKKQPIKQSFIREKILKENQICFKGYLILQGQVKLSKTVGDKNIVMANLVPFQVMNIEYSLYNKVHYNFIVNSSTLKYIILNSQWLQFLFSLNQKSIKQRQLIHNKEIQFHFSQKQKKQIKIKSDKIINRLSLPNINISTKSPKMQKTKKFKNQPIPAFFTYESDQLGKQKSIKIKRNSTQRVNSLASQDRSSYKQPNPRNQKLFKQQLKSIIKRKLVYEKKQLGVLQAFRQDIQKVIKQQTHNQQEQQNDIDLYFKL